MTATVSIVDHFKRLLDFSGREDRGSFWPYAAVVFGIVMVVSMLVMAPIMMEAMEATREIRAERASPTYVDRGDGTYVLAENGARPRIISPLMIGAYLAIFFGLSFLLYGAAVVRRLRDTGRSAFWALLPVPFILYSSIQMPRIMGNFTAIREGGQALFYSVFFSNLLYNISLIALIVLLAMRSQPRSEDAG